MIYFGFIFRDDTSAQVDVNKTLLILLHELKEQVKILVARSAPAEGSSNSLTSNSSGDILVNELNRVRGQLKVKFLLLAVESNISFI